MDIAYYIINTHPYSTIACSIIYHYTRSPLEDSHLFGPSPWRKILAATNEKKYLSNPAPGENLLSGNLVMETGCILIVHEHIICEPGWGSAAPSYMSLFIHKLYVY